MAIRTQRVCEFEGSIVLSFDWDDATGQVTLVRCVNTSPRYDVHVLMQGTGTGQAGRSREGTFAANSGTTTVSIPGGQRPRYVVQAVLDEAGQPTGELALAGYFMRAETI